MSYLFDRKVKIKIGRNYERSLATLVDEQFKVSFSVTLSNDENANEVVIDIYNLKESTRQRIFEEGDLITLEAGYAGQDSQIISIAKIRPIDGIRIRREPPDVITTIEALDGIKGLIDKNIALSFGAGFSFKRALEVVAQEANLSLKLVKGLDILSSFRQSTSYIAPLKTVINEIMKRAVVVQKTATGERYVQANHTFQSGELIVFVEGQPVDFNIVVLSEETGLLYSPAFRISEEEKGYTVTSLLNPALKPGVRLRLKSRDIDGLYIVKRVWHRGDTFGNEWTTICDLIEAL